MSNVTILPVLGNRRSVESATRWLGQSEYDALLLGMPEDFENFVQSYAQGQVSEDELWNSYRLMTGTSRPLVNSLRSKLKPLLKYLSNETCGHKIDIYCYDDLETHIQSGNLAEKILILSYRRRVCRYLDLEEWRRILLEEFHVMQSTWKRSVENLVEKAKENVENVVLYEGLIGPLVKQLQKWGLSVKVARILTHWRSPLDALRTAMWLRGESYLTNENIKAAVELHMKYLETVISSEDLDESERKWSDMVSFRSGRRRENAHLPAN